MVLMIWRLICKHFIKKLVLNRTTFYSYSQKVKSPTKDSSCTSTIYWHQVKSLSFIHPIKKNKLLTMSDQRWNQKVRSTQETTQTVGTGILIKLSKGFTCLFVSLLSVSLLEEEPDNSLPWLTTQLLIGSSLGQRMRYSMWPPSFWRKMI